MHRLIPILVVGWAMVHIAAATLATAQDGRDRQTHDSPKQVYCPVAPGEEIDLEVFTDCKGPHA